MELVGRRIRLLGIAKFFAVNTAGLTVLNSKLDCVGANPRLRYSMKRIRTVEDIVRWRLCVGCGACSYVCPEQAIELIDVVNEGIRPRVRTVDCQDCPAPCLQVCPSHLSDFSESVRVPGEMQELSDLWGPVLEIWEGHATDQEIRYRSASGGVLTALSLYCLEKEGMAGVLHIGQDPDNALRNRTRLSRSRSQLLENTGSRYAPASACDSLLEIESAPRPCVFIGQPSEVVALRKAQRLRPGLNAKVGLAMSFFWTSMVWSRLAMSFF